MAVIAASLLTNSVAHGESDTGPNSAQRPDIRIHGALINVADLVEALEFYSEILGFRVEDQWPDAKMVQLASDFPIYLREVPNESPPQNADRSRASITFKTANIASQYEYMNRNGVQFLADAPHHVGVGFAMLFRDPFGTVHSLLQQTIAESDPFDEPNIYNVGFHHSNVAETRSLYVETLGFMVLTEKYFPPALPLGYPDGSFGFMLHEHDLGPALEFYPNGTGTTLVFSTTDLKKIASYLDGKGVTVNRKTKSSDVNIPGHVAFRDVFGVWSEVWEIRH